MSGGVFAASQTGAEVRFIAREPRMRELVTLLRRLAEAPANLLLTGESGTGKDLAAQALHFWGNRARGPFIKVDLPSIPAELLESELFGHERGAFTGATAKPGKLEIAQGGTLYLDQIGELDPALQAKLLRVVEDKRFERLGGTRTLTLEARIVASTSLDMKQAVERKSFRPDLFHRLSVFWIEIPPLRERPADVFPLARFFLERESHRLGAGGLPRGFSREARQVLESYPWPGNVRELKGVVERAVLLTGGTVVEPSVLPEHVVDSPAAVFRVGSRKRPTLAELERAYIEMTLRHVRGNQTRAAEILGISRKALWEKRRRYGMS